MSTLNVVGGAGGVTTAGSGNTITISMAGSSPVAPFKITNFDSSGTWTKDAATTAVSIFLWCGGGGGSHGNGINYSGAGGSPGAFYFVEKEPEASFGATESIVIGAGGAGSPAGYVFSPLASPGGISSIGTFLVPSAQGNGAVGSNRTGASPMFYDLALTQVLYSGSCGEQGTPSGIGPSSQHSTATNFARNRGFSATGGAGGGCGAAGGRSGNITDCLGNVLVAGVNNGATGNDGIVYLGFQTGGTGGGGGYSAVNSGAGGNGGWPAGGGGGSVCGGGGTPPHWAQGGTGGDGYVIIWEYD